MINAIAFAMILTASNANCAEEAQAVRKGMEQIGGGQIMLGVFIPECDGALYKPTQFHPSTGYSWCVDINTGEEMKGTRVRAGSGARPGPEWCATLNGIEMVGESAPTPSLRLPTPFCAIERAEALARGLRFGGFVPQCDANGQYKPEQIHGSTGNAWCVNVVTGQEIQGTRIFPGMQRSADYCSRLGSLGDGEFGEAAPVKTCLIERAKALALSLRGMAGAFMPECDANGQFKSEQIHGSTGNAWCVNVNTGKEIQGTRVNTWETKRSADYCSRLGNLGDEEVGEAAPASTCVTERNTALKKIYPGMVGYFVPTCDANGQFTPEQVRGSTGQSWCVNVNTGKEIQGTRINRWETKRSADYCSRLGNLGDEEEVGEALPAPPSASSAPYPACVIEKAKVLARGAMRGAFVPMCNAQGLYQHLQIHGSSGCSWCVQPTTGEEIEGTVVCSGSGKKMPTTEFCKQQL